MVSAFWQPLPALPTSLSHFLASFTHRLLMLMLMVTQKKVAIDKNNLPNLDIAPAAVDDEYEFSSDILKLYLSTRIFGKAKEKERKEVLQVARCGGIFCVAGVRLTCSLTALIRYPFQKLKCIFTKVFLKCFSLGSLFGRNPVGVLAAHGPPSFPTPANLSQNTLLKSCNKRDHRTIWHQDNLTPMCENSMHTKLPCIEKWTIA